MIDQHAHPFALRGGPLDLSHVTLDVLQDEGAEERRRRDGPSRLFQELLAVRLSRRLDCDPDQVSEAREAASRDWTTYASSLFADAGITDLVMDTGLTGEAGTAVQEYIEASGCGVHPIVRLDPTVDRLIGEGRSAAEILEEIERLMSDGARDGAVGFKTILAYRTGLAVDPTVSLADAERSLAGEEPVRRRGKACRDLVLRRALGLAAELGRPFQIHTGFGDSDIRLAEADPLLLEELLRSPEGQAATVVLIHGAYPWTEQVAFLATVKPNVHAELSLSPIFAPTGTADRLSRILDLAPAAKVLVGTDGHGEPEVFWFAATVLREAWGVVAQRLGGAGARPAWVAGVRTAIFEGNAKELYGL